MVLKQNHVIRNFILSISTLILTISCTNIDDDYAILNKLIVAHLSSDGAPFYLMEKGRYPKDCLKQYYTYKYDKKEYNKVLKRFDSLKQRDSVRFTPYGKYIMYVYYHKNCINDSLFNKESLQYLLKQKDSIIWNTDKIKNERVIVLKQNDKKFKKKKKIFPNSISKPIYSKDKKFAIVSYQSSNANTIRLTFKKINDERQLINKIVSHI